MNLHHMMYRDAIRNFHNNTRKRAEAARAQAEKEKAERQEIADRINGKKSDEKPEE